jgi:large subunit ribosomal protein L23
MSATELTLIPRISEKSYALAQNNTYVFNVPRTANKNQVAAAVAKQYDVTVKDVRIVIVKGKLKQSYRKGGRPVQGQRKDVKKAYVTLAEGSSIKIFEEEQ